MTITNRFDAVSPLDSRFYGGDQGLYKALHPYLSASAATKYQARVEGALALALSDVGVCDKAIANAIASAADSITAQEVAEEETRTRHDVRALVNVIRAQVPDEAKRFVHLGATSSDISRIHADRTCSASLWLLSLIPPALSCVLIVIGISS